MEELGCFVMIVKCPSPMGQKATTAALPALQHPSARGSNSTVVKFRRKRSYTYKSDSFYLQLFCFLGVEVLLFVLFMCCFVFHLSPLANLTIVFYFLLHWLPFFNLSCFLLLLLSF